MKKLTFFLFLFCLRVIHALDCEPRDIESRYQKAIQVIDSQSSAIQDILNGKTDNTIPASSIFGHDFNIEKTQDYIRDLERVNNDQNGINPENIFLSECLTKSKKNKQLQDLKAKSVALNELKKELLKRNKFLRNSLKDAMESQQGLPQLKDEIQQQKVEGERVKRELEKDLLEAKNIISKVEDQVLKEIASYTSTLTKLKIDLLNKKLERDQELSKKLSYYEEISSQMSLISHFDSANKKKMTQTFEDVEKIWQRVTKENFYQLFSTGFSFDLPDIPPVPQLVADSNVPQKDDVKKLREELVEIKKVTIKGLTSRKEQEIKLLNDLLIQVNSVRSNLYFNLSWFETMGRLFSEKGIYAAYREVLTAPYRLISFFYSKYFYISEKLSLGRSGLTQLLKDIFKLIIIISLLFGLRTFFSKLYHNFDMRMSSLVSKFSQSIFVKNFASWWNKLKENFSLFAWLALLSFLSGLSELKSYILIIHIAQVLIFSRILKSLVLLFLGSVSRIDMKSFMLFKKKASETADSFKNIYLFYFLTMIFVEITIGKVYIYTILNFFVFIFSLFKMSSEAAIWEEEFKKYLERKFAGVVTNKLASVFQVFPKKVRALLYLISIILLSFFNLIIQLTEEFELSKKISANLFKKQIENIEAYEGAELFIPEEYKSEFSLNSLADEDEYVVFNEELEDKIKLELDEWLKEETQEHSLVVYGDKGIGKTTFLKHSIARFLETKSDINMVYSKMAPKTLESSKLESFLIENLMPEMKSEDFDIHKIDGSLEKKTVLIIDEAQNLFLSCIHGFEAYKYILQLINSGTKNIFWVLSFNKFSWLYLDRAFGRTQYFRNIFELRGWSDLKIKELIFKRHNKSPYQLSYDLLINATKSNDEMDRYSSIESKFFKLLWELSRGNPRTAIYLWLTALSRKNRKTFNVNIPKEANFEAMGDYQDDLMFVMAYIFRHENLTTSEIVKTTNLPIGIIQNALKVAKENRFIYSDEYKRHMIDVAYQYGLMRRLRVKNFIYGS